MLGWLQPCKLALSHYTQKRTHNRTVNENKDLDCCICNSPISKCIYDEGDVIAF